MSSSIIALLTDFGTHDWYVGLVKGVIFGVNPEVRIVDISHSVPRHSVTSACFALLASYRYFPEGTVFVVIVDPGVGGRRRIVCAQIAARLFLAPDNGVLTSVISKEGCQKMVIVENHEFFLAEVSPTFHGRDIFAPVAGHLSRGLPMERLGPETEEFQRIELPAPEVRQDSILASVQWVDSFGNLITDCPRESVNDLKTRWGAVVVQLKEGLEAAVQETYESVGRGESLGVIGSSGYLEVSVREGNASRMLGLTIGDRIVVKGK
jgi:S-adenosylmethionine hydrolase